MSENEKSEAAAKREAAREMAQSKLKKEKRAQARRKIAVQGVVASLAVVGIVGVVGIVSSLGLFETEIEAAPVEGPANMISGGVVLEEGLTVRPTGSYSSEETPVATQPQEVPHMTIFLDYSCPACKSFEEFFGEAIAEKVTDGEMTLEYQIIAFRDSSTAGTRYSTRSANAAVCVADQAPESFPAYHEALFASQPTSTINPQLTNTELINLAVISGVEDSDAIESCINEERFGPWIKANTARVFANGQIPVVDVEIESIQGTPTIFINGKQFTGSNLEALDAALAAE
jgi:protein-disulfide isomerase